MAQQISRKNHYVPEWYQWRFLSNSSNKLFYLSLSPRVQRPDGRIISYREVSELPPSRCFCEQDLYTTRFGEILNDEIERFLMGTIDTEGSDAVRAITEGNPRAVHEALKPFFQYIDAQKLRTPKGLDWIKSRYSGLTQVELMMEMQGLRQMHCTMWAEGVREIISAEDSDVKFIVTDHPVTIYNAAFPPESPACTYPGDPPIELIGSQTIFVLDENHCLILTNLEYAKNPKDVDLTARRTNARYRGHGVVRTDAYIRSRKFSRGQIIAVNYLLKRRAHKFIAAGSSDWLYPEQHFTGDWYAIGQILLPTHELWRFGGEIYVSYKDGSVYYQDEFGRTSGAHEYLRKKSQAIIGPNDNCGCGSGRKYKKCCQHRPGQDRPTWEVYSIRERNLMFSRAVQGILGLDKGKTWDDVRRELSDDMVKQIHEALGSLWPKDTDFASLLPRPDQNISRCVYLGTVDPRTVAVNAIGLLTYFDEIIIPNPFINPAYIRPKYNPINSPAQYKEQTLKNVILLLELEPFIHVGLIHLLPDPMDFNDELRQSVWSMATERTKNWKPSDEDMRQFKHLHEDDLLRSMRRLPDEVQRQQLLKVDPDMEDDLVERVLALTKEQHENDPLALLQPLEPGKDNAQVIMIKGFNLEIALFLAGLTGSFVYTDTLSHWRHLHEHTRAGSTAHSNDSWSPVIDAIKGITFPLQYDNNKLIEDRLSGGRSGTIRSLITRLLDSMLDDGIPARLNPMVMELDSSVQKMKAKWQRQSSETVLDVQFEFSVPAAGFENNAVRRLIVTFGRANNIRIAPIAMLLHIQQTATELNGA
ncbi:MAG TPA: DUF4238 domain-containing protein [Halothiobacillus sp.]|nr:DUF4238 domain-containing protein [Halothiobacillus sp.]